MEVADRIVVMNEGHIEQIGSPAEIYDHPATPFVMRFVGEVNVLPHGALPGRPSAPAVMEGALPSHDRGVFVRPHDVEIFLESQAGSLPVRLQRLTHMGRDLQAELLLESGDVVVAQLPRERLDHRALEPGDQLFILTRRVRTFVPDYAI
jgi:sulfate transport system ATP-binding protein